MKIALGSDHRGVGAARLLEPHLASLGHEVEIMGECSGTACDYPDNAWLVARAVADGRADAGILICGSGVGMSMAANKVPGIRAALVCDELTAQLSRAHNNANVLCLSGDLTSDQAMTRLVTIWLNAEFEGGRHERRVKKIAAIERGESPLEMKSDKPADAGIPASQR